MSDRVLSNAAGALRASAGGEAPGTETVARVLDTVRRRRRVRRVAVAVAVQLAVAVLGLGAWAARSGRLAELARRFTRPPAAAAAPVQAPRPREPGVATPAAAPVEGPPAPASLSPAPASSSPASAPAPRRRPRPAARAAVASAPEAAPALAAPALAAAPVTPPEEIYRQAHEAHFVRRDFAAALALWDRYLELGGAARLGVEARFNRAIALFQLGRRAEAAAALRPFVDGDYGSYRRDDARALLQKATVP